MIVALDHGVVMRAPPSSLTSQNSIWAEAAECVRWRLTLDRPVTLRGNASGQIVRTRMVYVTRAPTGCGGEPRLQIPKAGQPATAPLHYTVVDQPMPGSRFAGMPRIDIRVTTLQVLEPIWFEDARLER